MKNLAPRNDSKDILRWGDVENAIIGGEQTTKSTVDGGDNVFTFKDLKGQTRTLIVKNGSKGSAGAKGDKGDKGDTGAAGTAATITVGTVTTGAAGSSATVTNAGTASAAKLNFTIPQGAKGDKGDKGDTGAAGTKGADGLTTKVSVGGTTFSHSGGTVAITDAAVQKAVTPVTPTSGQIAVYDGTTGKLKTGGSTIAEIQEQFTKVLPEGSIQIAPVKAGLWFKVSIGSGLTDANRSIRISMTLTFPRKEFGVLCITSTGAYWESCVLTSSNSVSYLISYLRFRLTDVVEVWIDNRSTNSYYNIKAVALDNGAVNSSSITFVNEKYDAIPSEITVSEIPKGYNFLHPATEGNKHIPSGGASGNVLTWSAVGTAKWEAGYIVKSDANGYYIEV